MLLMVHTIGSNISNELQISMNIFYLIDLLVLACICVGLPTNLDFQLNMIMLSIQYANLSFIAGYFRVTGFTIKLIIELQVVTAQLMQD